MRPCVKRRSKSLSVYHDIEVNVNKSMKFVTMVTRESREECAGVVLCSSKVEHHYPIIHFNAKKVCCVHEQRSLMSSKAMMS